MSATVCVLLCVCIQPMLKPQYNFSSSNAELFPSAFTLAQLLCKISTVIGSSAPLGEV